MATYPAAQTALPIVTMSSPCLTGPTAGEIVAVSRSVTQFHDHVDEPCAANPDHTRISATDQTEGHAGRCTPMEKTGTAGCPH
jgi:hypothetical protein